MRVTDWLSILMILLVFAGCTTSRRDPGPAGTQMLASSTVDGRSVPQGESGAGISQVKQPAPSADYAFTKTNPVLVAGLDDSGPKAERRYLGALRGPAGQKISYRRLGSCCHFETPNSKFGGMLDIYEVSFRGAVKPLVLYLNMYDRGPVYVPVGLTAD